MRFFESLTRFLQGSTLVIALSMLVVGNMVFAHGDGSGPVQPIDLDEDGIIDNEDYARHDCDVCIHENYYKRYHAQCLDDAGLKIPGNFEDSDYQDRVMELRNIAMVSAGIDVYEELKHRLDLEIQALRYEQVAIKTCRNLTEYERDMREKKRAARWQAIGWTFGGVVVGAILGGLAASGGPGGAIVAGMIAIIVASVIALVWSIFDTFASYENSARDVYRDLCTKREV